MPRPRVPLHVSGTFHELPISRPLTVTPPLLAGPYVFPVVGEVAWGDSYGVPRSDVRGGWHHGDDIFGRLGQPVVAVAAGTVVKTGWERLGGWRLWMKDRANNRFYYAHLSGYTELARMGQKVKAGDVLGFIGHTGDAFTSLWHLHFEIHPSSLLYMRYDGAVDPTSYLASWRLLKHVHVPPPAALPRGAAEHGEGALSDYRKLLALRGEPQSVQAALAPSGPWLKPEPRFPAVPVAAVRGSNRRTIALASTGAAIVLAAAAGALLLRRRRQRSATIS